MRTYLELAPAPIEEECAQVGTPGYRDRALQECARLIRLLRKTFGPEPKGAWLSVKWFDHDFGPYCDLSLTVSRYTNGRACDLNGLQEIIHVSRLSFFAHSCTRDFLYPL